MMYIFHIKHHLHRPDRQVVGFEDVEELFSSERDSHTGWIQYLWSLMILITLAKLC
jgi:hypothetical protein